MASELKMKSAGGSFTLTHEDNVTKDIKTSDLVTQTDIDSVVGGTVYRGSNGEYVQNGDTVPVGTTHLRVLVGGKPTIVSMSPMADGTVSNLSETNVEIGGVNVNLIQWETFEYFNSDGISAVDKMVADFSLNPLFRAIGTLISTGTTKWSYEDSTGPVTIDNFRAMNVVAVRDFGAKGDCTGTAPDGTDDTQAFKNAISAARRTSTKIYASSGRYRISERLFFGPLSESDTLVQPSQSFNICTGLIGDGRDSTYLIPDSGLNGDVVIDLTGLREKFLRDFTILSFDPINCPAVGILTARFFRPGISAPTNNDWGEFSDVTVDKYFSLSPYFAHATEEIVVRQCKFRTDHDDALGAWVSTSDLYDVWPDAVEAEETSLSFTTGEQSNLHQKHYDCDYYMGSNSPTRSNPALVWSKGSLLTKITNGFYNNNQHKFDCHLFQKGPSQAFIFGISVEGANFHQTTKSGMILDSQNVDCSFTKSNRTVGFTDAELVTNGYTNRLFCDGLEGDLRLNNSLENSYIQSCRDLYFDEAFGHNDTFIGVDRDVIQLNTGNRVATNNFTLNHDGTMRQISGFYSTKNNVVSQFSANRTGKPIVQADSQNGSFDEDMFKAIMRTTSVAQFNYFAAYRNGVKEVGIRRGGFVECDLPTGGVVLTSPNGTKYRLKVDDSGNISTDTSV